MTNVFDTDLFMPLVQRGAELAGVTPGSSPAVTRALRTMAEHARGASFLIMDGVLPGNDGRDYVLRRIIRRAVQQAVAIGVEKPFLAALTEAVVEVMGDAYPALVEAQPEIRRVVNEEEVRFRRTLEQGMGILEEALRRARDAGAELPAEVAFELHDTYGFPFDLTREIAAEQDMTVDEERFSRLMDEQRERARSAQKEGTFASGPGEVEDFQRRFTETASDFVGYERLEVFTVVRALGELSGGRVAVKLAESPFYAEGGGQIADTGWIHTDSGKLEVENVVKFVDDQVIVARPVEGKVVEGERAKAMVNAVRRHQTACNHTATHLLHNALRIVLGEHVRQGGSMVRPERLRFDFAVREAPTAEQLRQVEDLVNRRIIENHAVRPFVTTREYAAEIGALAFFEEKYGEFVRVLEIDDFSRELCGGTHVSSTSQIGLFKITSSQSVGANTRRIEAITSAAAIEHYRGLEHEWDGLATDLKVRPDRLARDGREARHPGPRPREEAQGCRERRAQGHRRRAARRGRRRRRRRDRSGLARGGRQPTSSSPSATRCAPGAPTPSRSWPRPWTAAWPRWSRPATPPWVAASRPATSSRPCCRPSAARAEASPRWRGAAALKSTA